MREKIRKAKKEKEIIVGYKEVLKNLDKIEEILISRNCPKDIKEKIKEKGEGKVEEIELSNMEVGEVLGKPFSVSCLGIK